MYFIKEALFLFVYEIIMAVCSYLALVIDATWLKLAVSIICILFYLFIVYVIMKQTGENSAKKLHANDLNRLQIVKTGQDIKIETIDEYKWYKGFLIGIIACAPMIVLLIIHSIIYICGGTLMTIGSISSIIYFLFLTPIMIFIETFSMATHYIVLYGMALVCAVAGLGYMMGAKKIWAQYERIELQQREIYGE